MSDTPKPKEKTKDNKDFDEQKLKSKLYEDMKKELGVREYDPKKDEPLFEEENKDEQKLKLYEDMKKELGFKPYSGDKEYDPKKDEPLFENKPQFTELAGQWYLIKKKE